MANNPRYGSIAFELLPVKGIDRPTMLPQALNRDIKLGCESFDINLAH